MAASDSTVFMARRYLQRGFLDTAMRLFVRNPANVEESDWAHLAQALMERDRVVDAVRICETGGIPVPRERLLQLGDDRLRRRDVRNAIGYYELAEADQERWAEVVDVLARLPHQELLALEIAERYLGAESPAADAGGLPAADAAIAV